MDFNPVFVSELPRYAPVPRACDLLGFKRSKLYLLAAEGHIRLVKVGGRSVVDMEAALTWMRSLPTAEIAPSHKRELLATKTSVVA